MIILFSKKKTKNIQKGLIRSRLGLRDSTKNEQKTQIYKQEQDGWNINTTFFKLHLVWPYPLLY